MENKPHCPVCGSSADRNIDIKAKVYVLALELEELNHRMEFLEKEENRKKWPKAAANINMLVKGKRDQITNLKKKIV